MVTVRMNPKQRAGEAALRFVNSGMVVGLGTGSTADFFIQALAAALNSGALRHIRGLPTSRQSELRATELGIPLTTFADVGRADVTVDGADEVGPGLNLIKGLGGALLREKIVAQNSAQLVIIVDASKEVPALGTKARLPVEVAQFGHEAQATFLRSLSADPTLRRNADGAAFITDNGNLIYDCRCPPIDNPVELEVTMKRRAGIVETGLFIGLAKVVLIAGDAGVRERTV
jgi:ribose 5-phosphate isomerase A